MFWLAWLLLVLALAAVSQGSRRGGLLAIAAGLVVMQVWKHPAAEMPEWAAYFVTWVAVSGAIWRQADTKCQTIFVATAMTLLSAMCYPMARFGGEAVRAWVAIPADAFGLAAVIWLGGAGLVEFAGRLDLGSGHGGGNGRHMAPRRVVDR